MKLVFAGTPAFAEIALQALLTAGHKIELVLTQPDRPSGRGNSLTVSPVKATALRHGLQLFQPERLRDPVTWEPVRAADADAMVVAAYGLILPAPLLLIPRLGCLNIHASLLPRWRGAAPIQRAIEAGDTRTGIGIMQMEAGLDTGPVLLERSCEIGASQTGGDLHDRLAALGAQGIVAALETLSKGPLVATPQANHGVTYAAKIQSSDRWLDWHQSARQLADRIRAFDPVPGTATRLIGRPDGVLKVWSAREVNDNLPPTDAYPPGTVRGVGDRVMVCCGSGEQPDWLELLAVQRPGGQRVKIAQFQQGAAALADGSRFEPTCT